MAVWELLASIATTAGVSTHVGAWFQRRADRKKRLEEQTATRDEKHRDDLRRAYAEFISEYRRFLDAGILADIATRLIEELPREAYEQTLAATNGDEARAQEAANAAVAPETRRRGQSALEEFLAASLSANTRATGVVLLEDDQDRRAKLVALAAADLVVPQDDRDHVRFQSDVKRLRDSLNDIQHSLMGAFAPERWHADVLARRNASAAVTKRLGDKSSR
ncbi:MAG TPA: hypothetical protein VGM88_12470 [Kofleriaceae bacterium]|jgi:hypothetical protein